jgi:hypothetical protein
MSVRRQGGCRFIRIVLILAAPLAVLPGTTLAQDEEQTKRLKREREKEQAVEEAVEFVEQQAPLLEALVTYDQVLADPDNLQLNFRYAKTQVARGDLLGATATLERILMINPRMAEVHLFYAVVLYRLNNLEEANRELALLRQLEIPASIRKEFDDLAEQVERRRQRTKWTASVTTGFQFDTNRNAAASGKQRLASGAAVDLTGNSKKRRDTSFLGVHSLEAEHDLGTQAGHLLLGSFTYYLAEQTSVDDLDLQSFSGDLGALLKTKWADLTPKLTASHVMLSRETYQVTHGATLLAERTLIPRIGVALEGGWTHEDFNGIVENSAAPERKGDHVTASLTNTFLLSPSMQYELGLTYDYKDAKADYWAYEGYTMEHSLTWVLPKSQFLINSLSYERNVYNGFDPLVTVQRRRDDIFRYRITYGLPTSIILPEKLVPRSITKDLTAVTYFEQTRSLSNIMNFTYTNSKYSVMLTKRVEF